MRASGRPRCAAALGWDEIPRSFAPTNIVGTQDDGVPVNALKRQSSGVCRDYR